MCCFIFKMNTRHFRTSRVLVVVLVESFIFYSSVLLSGPSSSKVTVSNKH